MAELTNSTETKTMQETLRELSCSVEFTRGIHDEQVFLSVVNIFLSISAILGNTLILVALHKESSLHPPSKLLYRNLAITDLCVGIIGDPLQVAYFMSVVTERSDICDQAYLSTVFTGYVLCLVSLLTLTAISVDRLLALLLGLRYRQVVSLKRTYVAVLVFWIFSIVGASASFWNPLITTWHQYIVTALCLVTTFFSYARIFFTLIYNRVHAQDHNSQGQPSQAIPLNIARYRKAVHSALWVQVTLVVCYLPFFLTAALIPQRGMSLSDFRAWIFTATLVYFNSSLNPLLYYWQIKEVRQAVKDTVRELFCSSA